MVENIIITVFEIGVSVILLFKKFLIPFLRKYVEKKRKKQILLFVLKSKETGDF
ncbi:hypothetical protein LCGC14_1325000 [marine sediment metagenome]|uniref:Uncharacterized protein n=1 Tax=marine sediment metagenome TaxID=412755 RepID=A0A0F9L438_9ZZZZ